MKKKRKKKLFSKGNLAVISVALAAFTLYAVITLVGQQLKIAEKKRGTGADTGSDSASGD